MSRLGPISRRRFVKSSGSAFAAAACRRCAAAGNLLIPTSPVGIARCRRYDFDQVRSTLQALFLELGGIPQLVQGKTVYMLSTCQTVFALSGPFCPRE